MSESSARKRNLPAWMSSREEENDEGEKARQPINHRKSSSDQNKLHLERKVEEESSDVVSSGSSGFSKLMEGVVFALSGFVNPERGILRSQMLEMGAEYQPDWNSNCTLLVCAFSNTPKFRQVKAEGGTVINKDWISESYSQRKLVDIEPFLLHAGKPWRRPCISHEAREDIKPSTSSKPLNRGEESSHPKKSSGSLKMKGRISPSNAKKWAVEDLKRTILWLESQDEKPEPSEIKKIAAEGILTCLQDAIDALKQGEGMQKIADKWACLPKVIEELTKFDCEKDGRPKEELCREAMACRQIYELEFLSMEHDDAFIDNKRPKNRDIKKGIEKDNIARGDTSYDSDATIEMTEEEIDQAYNNVVCSL
ncbi:DNA-repair protein XRCC1 [Striga hermonthica]|uniref:DNA-repair protein XRCC1 n=1 Tax=Striga hermonthica TaxID=68872 RepID=A0A9N7NVY2_STRHE|nr:DNA-repair protein XRCC1 [Striga hermonthica]